MLRRPSFPSGYLAPAIPNDYRTQHQRKLLKMSQVTRHASLLVLIVCAALAAGCGGAAGRKAAYLDHGRKYLADQNYEKARIEFGNALQLDPKDPQTHFMAGKVAEKLGDPRQAAGHYQAAIELDPKFNEARAALGRLYIFGGFPDKAIETVQPGLALDPKNAALLTVRGGARARQGNMEGALADAEEAFRSAPDDGYAISLLASLYKRGGHADKALEMLLAAVTHQPDSVDLRTELADLELDQQHPDAAEVQIKKLIELEPHNVQHRYFLVRFYLLTKNVDAAEKALRDTVAAAPDDGAAKLALVEFLANQRGPDQADAQLAAYIKAEPDNDELKLAQAEHLRALDKLDQAEAVYRQIMLHAGVQPAGLRARDRLAMVALQRQDTTQAESLIAEVLKENPGDNEALTLRGDIELGRGDPAAAIADLRTVLRDQPNSVPTLRALARAYVANHEAGLAEDALTSAVQANPQDLDARFDLAGMLRQSGKLDQARKLLEQLAADAPNKPEISRALFELEMSQGDKAAARSTADRLKNVAAQRALGCYFTGLLDEQDKQLDAAASEYEQALAERPEAAEPLSALVRVDVARKSPDKALEALNAVIARNPNDGVARGLKGEFLVSQHRYDEAVQAYTEAIQAQPTAWGPYQGLAQAQLATHHADAAMQTLADGVARNPDALPLSTQLASLYEHAGRIDDAVAMYESVLKRNPKSVVVANNLAVLLIDHRGDPASLARAQALDPLLQTSSDAAVQDTRGWTRYKAGDYREAVPLLEQAVRTSPQSPEFQFHLGMAQFKAGDLAGAEKNLVQASASPAFSGTAEAANALSQIRRARQKK